MVSLDIRPSTSGGEKWNPPGERLPRVLLNTSGGAWGGPLARFLLGHIRQPKHSAGGGDGGTLN